MGIVFLWLQEKLADCSHKLTDSMVEICFHVLDFSVYVFNMNFPSFYFAFHGN